MKRDEAMSFRKAVTTGDAGLPAQTAGPIVGAIVTQKLDLVKCKPYCPPHTMLHHCPFSNRIRGYYMMSQADRPSHGCTLAIEGGQDTAIRVVLTWLWKEHHRRHPSQAILYEFPHSFDQ